MSNTDFPYQVQELSAFAVTYGTFIISLKNGKIVHYNPDDEKQFHEWLLQNEVRYLALRN